MITHIKMIHLDCRERQKVYLKGRNRKFNMTQLKQMKIYDTINEKTKREKN